MELVDPPSSNFAGVGPTLNKVKNRIFYKIRKFTRRTLPSASKMVKSIEAGVGVQDVTKVDVVLDRAVKKSAYYDKDILTKSKYRHDYDSHEHPEVALANVLREFNNIDIGDWGIVDPKPVQIIEHPDIIFRNEVNRMAGILDNLMDDDIEEEGDWIDHPLLGRVRLIARFVPNEAVDIAVQAGGNEEPLNNQMVEPEQQAEPPQEYGIYGAIKDADKYFNGGDTFIVPDRHSINSVFKRCGKYKVSDELTHFLKMKHFMKHRDFSLVTQLVTDARTWLTKKNYPDNRATYHLMCVAVTSAFMVDAEELIFRALVKNDANLDNTNHVNAFSATGNLGRKAFIPREHSLLGGMKVSKFGIFDDVATFKPKIVV